MISNRIASLVFALSVACFAEPVLMEGIAAVVDGKPITNHYFSFSLSTFIFVIMGIPVFHSSLSRFKTTF